MNLLSIFTTVSLLCISQFTKAQHTPPWQDPQLNGINRVPAKATSHSYETIELVKLGNKKLSRRFKTLNGQWRFRWHSVPENALPHSEYRLLDNEYSYSFVIKPIVQKKQLTRSHLP